MKEVYFVGAARTPIGRYRGSLKAVRIQDLAAATMKAAIERACVDSSALDMSIYSQSMQSSLPANIGRYAWTLAGLSEDPAGFTLNTLCAGALQTMISGFNKILGEEYSGALVGGVESYSMSPYYLFHPRYSMGPQSMCFHDPKIEVETNAQPRERYGALSAADIADMIALRCGFGREDLDEYVCRDCGKYLATINAGGVSGEIVPVAFRQKGKEIFVTADDPPTKSTPDELMSLPAKKEGGTATAANVARWADGAASLVMLSDERAGKLGCKPLVKMRGFGIAAGNPVFPEKITVHSIYKALAMSGCDLDDIDFFEIHHPSAAYALAVEENLGGGVSGRINVGGGSLSFGHPGAATGGVFLIRMISRLAAKEGRLGIVNVGAAGGQSLSIVVEGV